MGFMLNSTLKYIGSFTIALLSILYLLISVLDIPSCLSTIQVTAVLFVLAELFCVKVIGGADAFVSKEKPTWKIRGVLLCLFQLVCSVFAVHGILVLFGAPFLHAVPETFSLSLLLTALCCARPFVSLGPQALYTLLTNRSSSEHEVRAVLVLCGAWLGALPIPLDWDRPWQSWPITCTLGALLGEAVASCYLLRLAAARKDLHLAR